jgi:hypothetical protein
MTEQVQELPAVAPSEENAGRALKAFGANVAGRLVPWLVPVGLIVFWQIASSLGWLSTRVLPAPVDVVKAAWGLAVSGELWTHVKVSAGRALAGLAIGGGTGLVLGLLTGSVKFFETLLDSTIQMVRNIPALALIPLVILWFGIDESAKLFLISVSVFFPIYLNTFHGIRNVDPQLIVDPGGSALFARADVGDPDRGRNHLGAGRHRLPHDERPRVFADRHRAGGHPALCAAWQACRPVCAWFGAMVAALASGLPEEAEVRVGQ